MTHLAGSKRNRILKIGCSSLSFLMLGLCLWLYWAYGQMQDVPKYYFTVEDQAHDSDVVGAFAFSMAHNRIEDIRVYVVSERWDKLDAWPNIHEALSEECDFGSDPDMQGYMIGGRGASTRVWFYYACPNQRITFSVSLDMIMIDGKWYVNNWRDICQEGIRKQCW